MSKPIFLVKVPAGLSQKNCDDVNNALQKKLSDWHVLVVGGLPSGKMPEFSCYHIGNATDIEIEEFKKIAIEIINENHG